MSARSSRNLPRAITLRYLVKLASQLGYRIREDAVVKILQRCLDRFTKSHDFVLFLADLTAAFCKDSTIVRGRAKADAVQPRSNVKFAFAVCVDSLRRSGFVRARKGTRSGVLLPSGTYSRARIRDWIRQQWRGPSFQEYYSPSPQKGNQLIAVSVSTLKKDLIKRLAAGGGSRGRDMAGLLVVRILGEIRTKMKGKNYVRLDQLPGRLQLLVANVISSDLTVEQRRGGVTVFLINE